MVSMVSLVSQNARRHTAFVAILSLFGCSGSGLLGQTQATQAPQAPATASPAASDPTRPEIQPNLELDRDPIVSPDVEDNAAVNPSAPTTTDKANAIQKRQDGLFTMHQDVDEVLQYCTVVDEKGKLVNDLTIADFRVWENGIEQKPKSFQHQDVPVSIGILVDNSGSMRDKRTAVNQAALNLVKASNSHDSAFIVNFSDRAFLDQGFTSDIEKLNHGLAHYDAKGPTALYDAVAASADELSRHAKQPKQALLIITDGADNASRLNLEQAIRRVQNLGGPVVYTIGLLFDTDKAEAQKARSDLQALSEETGGIAYFPGSLQDVDAIASEVAHDIRNQYTIGYQSTIPAKQEGYRTVRVEARAPKHTKYIVRTRRGYYAKKPTVTPSTQTAQDTKPGETKPQETKP